MILWRREGLATPVFLPGESHGQRSLAGFTPWWGRAWHDWATFTFIPDETNCLYSFHTPISDFGEGNGTPLQCSCLENPMDGGAWWAAVHGVTKSRTRLSDFTFSFHFHALEKEKATHSSVLAWRIPGTGEPAGLPSMGSHGVRRDWGDLAAAAAFLIYTASWLVCLLYRQISLLDLSLFSCVYKNAQDVSPFFCHYTKILYKLLTVFHTPITHSFCTWKFVLLSWFYFFLYCLSSSQALGAKTETL